MDTQAREQTSASGKQSSSENTRKKKQVSSSREKPDSTATRKRKLYDVFFYQDWCKSCGICIAFCPKQIITADRIGKPTITEPDRCVGCRFCEIHCPDFAITVTERRRERRNNNV